MPAIYAQSSNRHMRARMRVRAYYWQTSARNWHVPAQLAARKKLIWLNGLIDTIALNGLIDPIALNGLIDPIALNVLIDTIALNGLIDPIALNGLIYTIALNILIDPIALNGFSLNKAWVTPTRSGHTSCYDLGEFVYSWENVKRIVAEPE